MATWRNAVAWIAANDGAGNTTPNGVAAPTERRRDTIDGPEKLCIVCGDWWPADGEFFYPAKRTADGLFYCCKACYREMRRDKAPAALPLIACAPSVAHANPSLPDRLEHRRVSIPLPDPFRG